jgi:hypothetical protein
MPYPYTNLEFDVTKVKKAEEAEIIIDNPGISISFNDSINQQKENLNMNNQNAIPSNEPYPNQVQGIMGSPTIPTFTNQPYLQYQMPSSPTPFINPSQPQTQPQLVMPPLPPVDSTIQTIINQDQKNHNNQQNQTFDTLTKLYILLNAETKDNDAAKTLKINAFTQLLTGNSIEATLFTKLPSSCQDDSPFMEIELVTSNHIFSFKDDKEVDISGDIPIFKNCDKLSISMTCDVTFMIYDENYKKTKPFLFPIIIAARNESKDMKNYNCDMIIKLLSCSYLPTSLFDKDNLPAFYIPIVMKIDQSKLVQ